MKSAICFAFCPGPPKLYQQWLLCQIFIFAFLLDVILLCSVNSKQAFVKTSALLALSLVALSVLLLLSLIEVL